jgi:hypothetical protein
VLRTVFFLLLPQGRIFAPGLGLLSVQSYRNSGVQASGRVIEKATAQHPRDKFTRARQSGRNVDAALVGGRFGDGEMHEVLRSRRARAIRPF